ncbi:DUF5107 domain-containing protein [Dactylosporangium fulvum]|uniref:DUF5107 domain-containing protein n=1 Tax=Dactylosporangium fulvum TaxID=53359 RepID=A0ABY5VRZ9_9ACTN|nr:DUF5107 domain-containing protein [Dactylosporangium fulvum]UWP80335.1 DUF5107 domain-containing protein [Dactylosporangium fulvum]
MSYATASGEQGKNESQGNRARLLVTGVRALDTKSFEITFNNDLTEQIRQFVTGNPAYLTEFIRVSGGTAGQPDAALDGGALNRISGTRLFVVDGATSSLRVLLGAGASLGDARYQVWFDGKGRDLADDLLIAGANGSTLRGTTTTPRDLRGTTRPAEKASIASATATDSRSVRIVFANPVYAAMPASRYTGTGITVTRPDGTTVRPVYVQKVGGTDNTAWDLTFSEDLGAGSHAVAINGAQHALTTSIGNLANTDVLSASFEGVTKQRSAPRVTDITVSDDRETIVVSFDRKIAAVNGGDENVPLAETPGGTGGTTLTRAQLLAAVDLSGVLEGAGDGASTLAQNLEKVAAYAPDLHTLVIKIEKGSLLKASTRGSVTIQAGAVTDLAGVGNTRATVDFKVPNSKPKKTSYDPNAADYLRVDRNASVTFRHNAFEFTNAPSDLSVRRENVENRLVNEKIDAIRVENKYIEATFIPGYGGRLLSLIYKPTGNDLLYTNPTGTPYGFNNNPVGRPGTSPFYHNWLMVWGGIFPTVTEAEHGKYWFLPWDYSISETADAVSITMTNKDTVHYADRPSRYVYGPTRLETAVTYTVGKTAPSVDMSVGIHNPGTQTVSYEYWTCTTLAPGAASDQGSPTMEIVSPVSVIQRDPAYTWMANVEKPANPATPNDRYLVLDKLNKMVNWRGDGIAYGQGLAQNPQGDWWGVINHENGEGVVRVGDNKVTPGMKFWEWGFNSSFDTNIYRNGSSARPYIELWAGTSDRFFQAAKIAPGATTSWTETFLPTMDLAGVTNANKAGAAEVAFQRTGGKLTVRGDVFSTHIGQNLRVELVDKATGRVLAGKSFTATADQSADLSAEVVDGATVQLVLTDRAGNVLLQAEKSAAGA